MQEFALLKTIHRRANEFITRNRVAVLCWRWRRCWRCLSVIRRGAAGMSSCCKFVVKFVLGAIGWCCPSLCWCGSTTYGWQFFLLGLEIKRELLEGELASVSQAMLPAGAALGGMLVPALIYRAINWGDAVALRWLGW